MLIWKKVVFANFFSVCFKVTSQQEVTPQPFQPSVGNILALIDAIKISLLTCFIEISYCPKNINLKFWAVFFDNFVIILPRILIFFRALIWRWRCNTRGCCCSLRRHWHRKSRCRRRGAFWLLQTTHTDIFTMKIARCAFVRRQATLCWISRCLLRRVVTTSWRWVIHVKALASWHYYFSKQTL